MSARTRPSSARRACARPRSPSAGQTLCRPIMEGRVSANRSAFLASRPPCSADAIQRQVEIEDIHPRLAEDAKEAPIDMAVHDRPHRLLAHAARLGDPRNLVIGAEQPRCRGRGQMPRMSPDRPESACQRAHRDSPSSGRRSAAGPSCQIAFVGPRFEPAGVIGLIGRGRALQVIRRRGPPVEILRLRPVLADQRRGDGLAIDCRPASHSPATGRAACATPVVTTG